MDPHSMLRTSSLPENETQPEKGIHPDPLRPPTHASPEAPQQPQQQPQQPTLPPPEFWQDYFLSAGFPGGDQARPSVGQGWSTLARVVRDVDEEKIKQHKEDIDTILVFAGLFSAVMTAFLVESYKNLSPDPTDIQTRLLQQIASQTSSDPSNTTTTVPMIPSSSDFQPSTNAVRVNVLWFTSLTLSLVSASLAILVKQWLREYLAGEYTSPQAHLRIRHFRNPGLRHWKVFELAAAVPLLLQLCLALFLIGLCFFTADVHSTIGHTTLPLVAGWGFLIVAATLSPIFSSRCPYKTSLFMSILSGIRKRLFELLRWLTDTYDTSTGTNAIAKIWSHQRLAYDEQDAVETDANDLEILVAVDATQSDEHLLNIMWDALQQIQLGPAESVRFVKEILGNWLQVGIPDWKLAIQFPSLARLPPRFTASIMLMLGDILDNHFKEAVVGVSHSEYPQWTYDCLFLLLSDIDIPLPAAVNQAIARILMEEQAVSKPFIDIMKACVPHEGAFSRVLRRLQGAFRLGKQERLMGALQYLVQKYFCADHHEVFHTLSDIARDHTTKFTGAHRRELGEFFMQILTNRTPSPNQPWGVLFVTVQIVLELLSLSDRSWRPSVVKLFRHLALTQANVLLLAPFTVGYNIRPDNVLEFRQVDLDSILSMKPEAQNLILDAFMSADGLERPQMVNSFTAHIAGQWRPPFQLEGSSNTWEPKPALIDALEACHLFIRLIATMKSFQVPIDTTMANELRDLFRSADKGLHAAARARKLREDHTVLAMACLGLINSLDISPPANLSDEAYLAWAHGFPEHETLFPDSFIGHLAAFIPKDADLSFSHRIRRLAVLKRHRGHGNFDVRPGGVPRNIVPGP